MDDNYIKEAVYFSELKIVFDYTCLFLNESIKLQERRKKYKYSKKICLFKIHPGSIVFIEDCDFSCDKNHATNKLICFQINAVTMKKENEDIINNIILKEINFYKDTDKEKEMELKKEKDLYKENQIKNKDNKPKNIIKVNMKNFLNKDIASSSSNSKININKISKELNPNEININLDTKSNNFNNNLNNKASNNKNRNSDINNQLQLIKNKKDYNKITVINILSTKISKFYQTIRAGDNVILNMEKNYITCNIGKSIVFLNPLFVKISESIFENNYDNVIHIKFVKERNFINVPRKIIIEKNDISYNHHSGLYIDGVENFILNLDLFILNNTMKGNKIDGIFLCDIIVNFLLISDNKLIGNESNGINIYKVYQRFYNPINSLIIDNNININNNNNNIDFNNIKNSLTLIDSNFTFLDFIIIKNNEFFENTCVGMMVNFSNAILYNNSFISNSSTGAIICEYDFAKLNESNKGNNSYSIKKNNNDNNNGNNNNSKINNAQILSENNSSTKGNTNSLINSFINSMGISIVIDCTFNRNLRNGLKILNYKNLTYVINCTFCENKENGLVLENEKEDTIFYNDQNINDKNNNNSKNSSKVQKVQWNTDKSLDIKKMDFSEINKWFENIIKITKNTFNKNLDNKNLITNKNNNLNLNLNCNLIDFNINKFLYDNRNSRFSLDFDSSLSCENILSIFSDIRKIINENLFNFPKELKDLIIPYTVLSNSTIENNSKSGVYLSNCILNSDKNNISENGKYSIHIEKEDYKNFYIENKNRKNRIEGNIGGGWGILETDSFCGMCFNSNDKKTYKKNNDNDKSRNDKDNKKKKEKNCQIF